MAIGTFETSTEHSATNVHSHQSDLTLMWPGATVTTRNVVTHRTSTETPSAERMRRQVGSFLSAHAVQRNDLRELLVQELRQSQNHEELAAAVAQECVASSKAGRLDDAVDILSAASISPAGLASALAGTRGLWEIDEDLQYIIVSLAATADDPLSRTLLRAALGRFTGAACEAAVQAFAASEQEPDRGAILRWVGEHTRSETIKAVVDECLADHDDSRGPQV